MVKAAFNNGKTYKVNFKANSESVVTLNGDVEINTSGFQIRRIKDNFLLGDYSDFTTIYGKTSKGIMFTNEEV